jgi:lipopolysaccharide assembly outer membrane protein LptD (OstA)
LRLRVVLRHLTTVLFTVFIGVSSWAQTPDRNVVDADSLLALKLKEDTLRKSGSLPPGSLQPSDDALDSRVEYKARDSMRFDLKLKKIFLYGAADVKYDKIHLTADYIEINWGNNVVHAEGRPDSTGKIIGHPVFDEGTQTFDAERMDYNFKTKKGRISGIFTQQGDGYIHGEQVKKSEKDEFYIRNGKYTTCNLPDHPHFYINASKIKVMPGDKIVSGPANLWIEDVPTPLAVPFGIFPNSTKRKSGIIFPTYGESPGLGFFLQEGGYYFGINDYIDASIRGNIYSRGSWGLSAGTSYNYRYHFNGSLDLRYSKILQGDPELLGSSINKDFFITWKHTQDPKSRPNSRFSASVQAGSSNFNKLNSLNANNIVANTFQSSISYAKTFANTPFNMVISAGHSQNTATRVITLSAPELQVNMNRYYPFKRKNPIGKQKEYEKIGITYTLQSKNTISQADSLYGRPGWTQKFNNGVQHQIPISTSIQFLRFFTFTPAFNYNERWYLNTIEKYYDEKTGTVQSDTIRGFKSTREWNASANFSTRLYGFLKLGKNTVRNVMTPQVSYRYQPDFSTRRYGFYGTNGAVGYYSPYENGLYGQPSVGRQGTVGITLNNNLEGKFKSKRDTTGTGLKKVVLLDAFNFSTGYNLAADSLNWQNLSINARTKLFKKIDVVYSSSHDFYAFDTTLNARVNTFEYAKTGHLFRNLSTSLSLTTTLASGQKQKLSSQAGTDEERADLSRNPYSYVDFTIPWSLNAGLVLSKSNTGRETRLNQEFNVSGDLNLTSKWKIGFSTWYDFVQKEFSLTTIDIFRDLHCWEMHFNWIPFGFRQSYNFTINVKSSMLQDLKVNRRRQWYDLQNQ